MQHTDVQHNTTQHNTMYGEKKGKSRSKNPNDNILCVVYNVYTFTHSFLFHFIIVVACFLLT